MSGDKWPFANTSPGFDPNNDGLNLPPSLLDDINSYLGMKDLLKTFIRRLTLGPEPDVVDELHKSIFKTSRIHPRQLKRTRERIKHGISTFQDYCEENAVTSDLKFNLERTISQADEPLYLSEYLNQSTETDQLTTDVEEMLTDWPVLLEVQELSIGIYINQTHLSRSVNDVSIQTMYELLENQGLGFLDTTIEMLEVLESQFKQILLDIGLYEKEDGNIELTDGGYRIKPAIFGSISLALVGLLAIVGGVMANKTSIIVSGCIAALGAIQGWPFEYEIEVDIDRIE